MSFDVLQEKIRGMKNPTVAGLDARLEYVPPHIRAEMIDADGPTRKAAAEAIYTINCGLMENYSVEYTAQKLRELCHRAGKYTIGVEPMPYSGLPDVKKAWAVVKESGCENAKLILDSWHWLRANQPVDLSVLEGIPAEKIVSVQINDVYERPYAASILRDESMHDRLAPGTGCGNTAAFCRMLKEKGVEPKAMGVEVISDAILAKGVAAAAKFNFDITVKGLQEGWPEAMPEK